MLDVLLTAAAGALSATVGVVVGSVLTRRAQERQWLRERQLGAYEDLFTHYARFTMELRRAHADRRGWDYDWGAWSAALMRVSLVAPPEVSAELEAFGRAVDGFLDRTARGRDPLRPRPVTQRRSAHSARSSVPVRSSGPGGQFSACSVPPRRATTRAVTGR
ncbi:hypothetical protein H9Y04_17060 [Streptomyces sp. TRM66268-LWL]|uniref:Secreted protein n=1 Tax=Streptomyces polyasparticus TaxID=2767826 RepID=A0ABR7SH22_9ACTN|nr:hypothetical protein [Streptomyces polyasparticus]MBC9714272.1 hypothetical protein [Streptomyces polyasparticus]